MKKNIINWIKGRINSKEFRDFLGENLMALCKIDTTPKTNLENVASNENNIYKKINGIIDEHTFQGDIKIIPFNKKIKNHPFYTLPNYTKSDWPYNNRGNLVYIWEPPKNNNYNKNNIALNAHIDTVPPYFSPNRKNDYIIGRGACDDKGGSITILGTLKLLKEISQIFNILPQNRIVCMFVTDEEIGGNGSLSLALDEKLKEKYNSIIVCEPTNMQIHPGNRGAIWYSIDIDYTDHNLALILAFKIILMLEQEGNKIREESIHPLFDKEVAQTCHGIFGPYGKHPSTICDEIKVSIHTTFSIEQLKNIIEKGLKLYIEKYGDKTTQEAKNENTNRLDHHFDLFNSNGIYNLFVWGISGHMGSIKQNDNAITKAAFIVNEIIKEEPNVKFDLYENTLTNILTLEGGQGFTPVHSIDEVKSRFSKVIKKALDDIISENPKIRKKIKSPKITFSKLHNDAFTGYTESKTVKDLVKASKEIGINIQDPLKGFPVSCDARIFAKLNPQMDVITMGPGLIEDAHSDNEKIIVNDIAINSGALALFVLEHSNALDIGKLS